MTTNSWTTRQTENPVMNKIVKKLGKIFYIMFLFFLFFVAKFQQKKIEKNLTTDYEVWVYGV